METDHRRYKRLPLKLTVLCQKVGVSDGRVYSGTTLNVGTGGMLIEMSTGVFREGDLISMQFTIPPTEGLLEFGGSFSGYGRVIRGRRDAIADPSSFLHAVAIEFCQSPHFQV